MVLSNMENHRIEIQATRASHMKIALPSTGTTLGALWALKVAYLSMGKSIVSLLDSPDLQDDLMMSMVVQEQHVGIPISQSIDAL